MRLGVWDTGTWEGRWRKGLVVTGAVRTQDLRICARSGRSRPAAREKGRSTVENPGGARRALICGFRLPPA